MWWQQAWVWLAAGLVLAIIEVMAPGYIFLGFAIGAIAVGVLTWLNLAAATLPMLLLTFALVSLVAWIALRHLLGSPTNEVKVWTKDINED